MAPHDDGDRKFDDVVFPPGDLGGAGVWGPEKAPDIEIIEEREALVLLADVPAVEREDIRVDVSPHRVVLHAVSRPGFDALRGIFRRDRPFLSFERAITLPAEVRPDLAEAHYNNGVLEVILPKRAIGGVGVYRLPAE